MRYYLIIQDQYWLDFNQLLLKFIIKVLKVPILFILFWLNIKELIELTGRKQYEIIWKRDGSSMNQLNMG